MALAKKLQIFLLQDIQLSLSVPVGFNTTKRFVNQMMKEGIVHFNEQLCRYVITW